MNFYLFIVLLLLSFTVAGQTAPVNAAPYGKVDMDDLVMTTCDFEKDANAEILFDKGIMKLEAGRGMERHIRIKIFNDFGKKNATVHLLFHSGFLEGRSISGLEGETINLEGTKIVTTPLDKGQIFLQHLNKKFSEYVFTFPNVKAGSIIEYRYKTEILPVWFFQNDLPTRYSEIQTTFVATGTLSVLPHNRQTISFEHAGINNPTQKRYMTNLHSLPEEPYTTARIDNLERVEFSYSAGFSFNNWSSIVTNLIKSKAFGDKLDEPLPGEAAIVEKAKKLKNDEERIAFIYDTVKSLMKWNKQTFFLTSDELSKAWQAKTGNSAEINLVLFHLLQATGINAFPMVLSTRGHGQIQPANANPYLLNNTVVYVQVDKSKYYVLDASNSANVYNTIPYNDLSANGVSVDIKGLAYLFIHLQDTSRVLQSVYLNAEIQPQGKMTGTAEITSSSHNKIKALEKYNSDGEKKYIDSLHVSDNNIVINSFKMEDMNVDTLSLTQKIGFTTTLTGSDENYIYFNLNSFTYLESNPFISEYRYSDIDLGFRNDYSMNGIYKIPAGYKVDALPKNKIIIMPDRSIIFKRTLAQGDGMITVRCIIEHGKTFYLQEEYQNLRGFYKEMYELLNEPIVLKKL